MRTAVNKCLCKLITSFIIRLLESIISNLALCNFSAGLCSWTGRFGSYSLETLKTSFLQMRPIWFWKRIWSISRWLTFWISEQNDFINKFLNFHVAPMLPTKSCLSHIRFRKCHLKNFRMAAKAPILDIWTEQLQKFWISVLPPMPPYLSTFWHMAGERILEHADFL